MRRAFEIILISVVLSQAGCAAIGETLICAIFDSGKSKEGTSADKSLPKDKRRALYEQEFRDWTKENEAKRRREQYRERQRNKPAEWENAIDSAFP
jgi:hypothetical protein